MFGRSQEALRGVKDVQRACEATVWGYNRGKERNIMPRAHNVPENYDPKAKLHSDLIPYRQDGWIRHPLVVRTEHPETRFDVNLQYESNLEQLRIAKRDKDWLEYVFTHERPYRLQTLLSLAEEGSQEAKGAYGKIAADLDATLTNSAYWKLVAAVWTDLENIWQYVHQLHRLFYPKRFDHAKRRQMMKTKERGVYDALPDIATVYRGCGDKNRMGWSWTIDKQQAVWFARRFAEKENGGILLTARCPKPKILALFLGRRESEVVIDPSTVRVRQIKATVR